MQSRMAAAEQMGDPVPGVSGQIIFKCPALVGRAGKPFRRCRAVLMETSLVIARSANKAGMCKACRLFGRLFEDLEALEQAGVIPAEQEGAVEAVRRLLREGK
jgi:hypothetical protein